jgi:hypothetical protein
MELFPTSGTHPATKRPLISIFHFPFSRFCTAVPYCTVRISAVSLIGSMIYSLYCRDRGEGQANQLCNSRRAGSLQMQQTFRVGMRDLLFVRGADRQLVEERAGLRHGCVRMVSGEHDAFNAHLEE